MTKAQVKEIYRDWAGEILGASQEDKSLENLKDLCEKFGDGQRWCSWDKCLEEIIKGGNRGAILRAFQEYNHNIELQGARDAVRQLAKMTDNMNI